LYFKYAQIDEVGIHYITKDDRAADIIVYVGSSHTNFSDIRNDFTYTNYRSKTLIFYSGDKYIPIIPGIYTSLENRGT